jgi:D-inositol-3-phosphate glycosyltransferase
MYQTSRSKGQELVAQRMVSYFRKLGHDAYLITSIFHDEHEIVSDDWIGDRGYVQVDDGELGIPIIRVASFTTRWPPRRIVFKDEVDTLERIVNDFQLNVLITHSTLWNGPEAVAKFVEWRRNIKALGGYQDPLIFCHMSHYQEPSPRRYSLVERSFRMAWNRVSLRTILRIANLILVVTPYEEESKRRMGASRQKCVLFPGGVDDSSFMSFATANPKELRDRLKLDPNVKIVTYVGTIEERKNPKAVLEVAEKLKENEYVHFVIAGRGNSEYADEVRTKAESLRNVTYLGEISEREKVLLIRASYLNILLSRMEALGLAQLEFMFEGVPVITSGVGGQAWIIEDNKEGMHVRGAADVEGAVQAVEELVSDRSRWERFSASAKEKAKDFALTKLIEQLDSALTKEIEKESGLERLPPEVRSTLAEPEVVMRSWSHGTRRVAATSKRLFIQQGRLSRKTLEIPYSNISSIEHIRRYDWQVLLLGGILSLLLFTQHYLFPIISIALSSWIVSVATGVFPNVKSELSQILLTIWLVPVLIALPVFSVRARKGYALVTAAPSPMYLPHSFGEAIRHIREMQDKAQTNMAKVQKTMRDQPESEKLRLGQNCENASEN